MLTMSKTDNKYFYPLTWLRAFAAFFVVISHCIRATQVKYALNDEISYFMPLTFFNLGEFGVCLFFALSGCTLYLSNRKKISNLASFSPFIVKRFFRIWPAFAISLIIYILFIEVFKLYYTSDPSLWIAGFLKPYTFTNVLQYLSLTFNFTAPKYLFIGPYWSLPVEFQFYVLLPLTILLMKYTKQLTIIPLMFSVVMYMIYFYSPFVITDYKVFSLAFIFFGGVILGAALERFKKNIPLKTSGYLLIAIVILISSLRFTLEYVAITPLGVILNYNTYGFIALFCLFITLKTTTATRQTKFLVFLHEYGTISYSIYLFHMLFIGIGVLLIIHFEIYGDNLKLIFLVSFTLLGSYLFSKMSYKFIEMPSIKAGRYFASFFERDSK
ncbi:MAG: hypothetical protein COB35_10825 [Gammaproteobacteria bacterium]|nr:MAG: hypothetical protein COB35_10825 [Gammaproteobacteria bacterium]